MKKLMGLLVVVFICSLAAESIAQNIGLKGGLNFAKMYMKVDDETYSDDFKMNLGFLAGVAVEFPLSGFLSFESGLYVSTKGYKILEEHGFTDNGETHSNSFKSTANPVYVEIPVMTKIYFDLGGARLYGSAGPYAGIGVAGKVKSAFTMDGETESESEKINWGYGEDDVFKTLDFGILLGAGIDLGVPQIGISYGYGLANIWSDNSGIEVKNRVLSFTVGLKFGGR
jgi:hypothetical protein